MRRANYFRFRRAMKGQTPVREHWESPNRGNGPGRARAVKRDATARASRSAFYAETPSADLRPNSRQVLRAHARSNAKVSKARTDWRAALAAPQPDPPNRKNACKRLLARYA